MSAKPPNRLAQVDAVKGAAILLVVLGHAWRGLNADGLIEPATFTALDSRIYAFHMPVFFALSGLFFAQVLARSTPWSFLRSRVLRLLWPLILWTYIFLGIKVLAGTRANTPVSIEDLMILPVPGVLHLWFLWALLLLHLGFALTRPVLAGTGSYSRPALWIMAAAVLAAQAISFPADTLYWIGGALRHAPFFVIGLILGQSRGLMAPSGYRGALALTGFAVVLIFWPQVEQSEFLHLAARMFVTICFLLIFFSFGAMSARPLVYLGTASMAIYLTHTIFSASLREFLFVTGIENLTLHLTAGTAIGLIGPVVLREAIRGTRLERLMGF